MTKERAQEPKDGLKWPEWRLYANFLHRELARLWYGKKSVFTPSKNYKEHEKFWMIFSFIWSITIIEFGKTQGLKTDEITKRVKSAYEEYAKLSNNDVGIDSPFHPFFWFTRWVLGDELANKFFHDFQIAEITVLAIGARVYAALGKEPPYVKGVRTPPLEFYEGLPVAPELEAQFYGKGLA